MANTNEQSGGEILGMVESDPFGLKSVSAEVRESAVAAEQLFLSCEGLTRMQILEDRELRKLFHGNRPVDLPAVSVDKDHIYQLRRTVNGDGTIFSFVRKGLGYENAGFTVMQKEGLTFLTDLTGSPVSWNEEYPAVVKEAQSYLNAYASKLTGIRSKKPQTLTKRLTGGAEIDIPPALTRTRLARRMVAAAACLAPLPLPIHTWFDAGVKVPMPWTVQLGDDLFNRSEHIRQGFDAQHLQLPADNPVLSIGAPEVLPETPKLPSALADRLDNAPTLDADSGSVQDLYGGPRRLINLDDSFEGTMDPKFCEDVKIHANSGDQLRVANITPIIANQLEFSFTENRIVVCNVGSQTLQKDDVQHMFVQIVRG